MHDQGVDWKCAVVMLSHPVFGANVTIYSASWATLRLDCNQCSPMCLGLSHVCTHAGDEIFGQRCAPSRLPNAMLIHAQPCLAQESPKRALT
jgi:hypothetical protein